MANLNDKQSQLRSMLPVVLVAPGLRINDRLNEENRWLLFDRAWTLLAPAVERDGEHTQSSVLAALGKGERRLWVSATSAFITEIITYPTGLRVGNAWLAGGDLKEILIVGADAGRLVQSAWSQVRSCQRASRVGQGPGIQRDSSHRCERTVRC